MSAEPTRKLDRPRGDLDRAAARALLDGAARRLYRARHPRARAGPRGDVAEFPVGIYRRAVVRPRRLFRSRRLRRRADAEISRAEHAAGDCRRHAAGRPLRRGSRHPDRAAARRLFRHGHDRVRAGVLLHRLPVEFADRRRRRLARLLAPADRRSARSNSTFSPTPTTSISSCCSALRWPSERWASSCARRSAAP